MINTGASKLVSGTSASVQRALDGGYELHKRLGFDPVGVVSGLLPAANGSGLTVTVSAGSYVDESGELRAVAQGTVDFTGQTNGDYIIKINDGALSYSSATGALPAAGDLPLAYATKNTASVTPVYDVRNMIVGGGATSRMPWATTPYKDLCVVSSGTYQNAWKNDMIGRFDPYFALLGAWAFVDDEPAEVQALCDRVLAMWNNVADTSKIPAAYGTTTWLSLHGTTHAGAGDPGSFTPAYWPWRVNPSDYYDFEGSSYTPVRADSHDSYAAVLVRTMVRLARLGGSYATWWDTNFAVLKEIVYYNLLLPMQNVGGGYMTSVFQDKDVYAYCLTGDNCEVWRALADLCAWVTTHAVGAQTTWLSTNSVTTARDNVANGIHSAWNYDADPANEYLNWFYEIGVGWGGNDHSRFYPEMWAYLMPILFRAPLYTAAVDDRTLLMERLRRMQVSLNALGENAPYAGRSARYGGVYNYSAMFAAMYASAGLYDESRSCVEFWKRNQLRDGAYNWLNIADIGWIKYADDCVAGNPDAMGPWFEG